MRHFLATIIFILTANLYAGGAVAGPPGNGDTTVSSSGNLNGEHFSSVTIHSNGDLTAHLDSGFPFTAYPGGAGYGVIKNAIDDRTKMPKTDEPTS